MWWPFRRHKHEYIDQIISVPLPILMRQVIYDSIYSSSEEIAALMGLPPISDEVAQMEEDASQDRIARFAALLPFIDAQAEIAAQVSATAYSLEAGDLGIEKLDGEHLQELTKLFKLVSLSASISCISTLMNLGLLDTEVVSDDE